MKGLNKNKHYQYYYCDSSSSFLSITIIYWTQMTLKEYGVAVQPMLAIQWWEMKVNVLILQKLRVNWEGKVPCALWTTRLDGINQYTPKTSRPKLNPVSFRKLSRSPYLKLISWLPCPRAFGLYLSYSTYHYLPCIRVIYAHVSLSH